MYDGIIRARMESELLRKVDKIGSVTGLNRSQVLRELVRRVTFEPANITVIWSEINSSGVQVSEATHTAAVVNAQ